MQFTHRLIASRRARRWTTAALGLLLLPIIGGSAYAVAPSSGDSGAPATAAPGAALSQSDTMQPFEATGLPAGAARGIPARRSFPPGFNLKHVHGGPTYVYVISGSIDILDSEGKTTTYGPGDFFWEPPGYIHTAQTAGGVEVFILFLLPPSAEAIIPTP